MLFAGMYYMILLFCISLIRVELVVNERKIGSIIHVEKGEGSSCSVVK
jgi:hypothetical protein